MAINFVALKKSAILTFVTVLSFQRATIRNKTDFSNFLFHITSPFRY